MSIQSRLSSIESRNSRVESDKAWEVSYFRRVTIVLITYMIAVAFMWSISVPDYFLNALVPTGGYLLSTLALPYAKKLWLKF